MKSEQWKWVDIAKGIGIILVFLGHFNIPDTLRAEIYTFHIPLFFFLSGVVFNGHKPINRFLGDEAKRMIVPFFALGYNYRYYRTDIEAKLLHGGWAYWLLCITLFLANIGLGYLNYHLTGVQVDMFHNSYGNPFLMLLSACSGIAAVVLLSYRLNVRWIAYVGKNSMIYFVAHQRFYTVVDPYVLRILGIYIKNTLLLQWINAVVMVVACILLFSLINAVLSHIPAMAFMFGIKPNRSSK